MPRLIIAEIREREEFTQAALAKKMKPRTSQQAVHLVESGKRDPTFGWLARAAKALGVKVVDLIEEGRMTADLGPAIMGTRSFSDSAIVEDDVGTWQRITLTLLGRRIEAGRIKSATERLARIWADHRDEILG